MKFLTATLMSLLFFIPAISQDTDSLILEDVKSIRKSLNAITYQLNKNQEIIGEKFKDIETLNDSTLKELYKAKEQINEGTDDIKQNTEKYADKLHNQLITNEKKYKTRTLVHYILHGTGIILIIFLIWYIRREKKNDIDYLVKEAQKHSVQNDDILEKAKDMSKIKDRLKKVLKQQKKLRKKKK
jgi:hypothetical protein